ncbi:MAG: D-alanine--D-alanine ligase, partial [Pseudomonadota bacterium]
SDFRLDDGLMGSGELAWLEINTQPGMTPTSLAPEQAGHLGISFEDLCHWLVEDASCGR